MGKIVYHDLEKSGKINYYNIEIDKTLYKFIPARLMEAVKEQQHEHEERD